MFAAAVRADPRAWALVALTFVGLSLVFSARSALGLMIPTWEQELGWGRTFVSTGGSVVLVMMALVSPLAGNLLDRVGPRPVYVVALAFVATAIVATSLMTETWHFIVLFCILGGIGLGAFSVPVASATMALTFDEHRGLATGMATAGASGGQLIVVPLLALVVSWIGWRAGFVAFGFTIAALVPVAWVVMRGLGVARARGGGGASAPLGQRLRYLGANRTFWLLFGGFTICGFTTTGVIEVHLIPYAAASGYPPLQGATAYGVLSAFNMAGMILAGYLADRMSRPLLLGAIYFFRAASFIILMFIVDDISLLFIFAVMFGVFDYSTMPVLASLVASHIGLRIMGLTLGILFAGHSVGAAAGSFAGGYLFDLLASYDWVWIVSIALALVAAVMSVSIRESREAPSVPAFAAA